MEIKKIKINRSKTGIPCLWEAGGGYTNTGYSQIICDKNGNPKKAIYIRKQGTLACGDHALIPIIVGDIVIFANHHRGDFNIEIYQITQIQEHEAELSLLNSFSQGEWDTELDNKYKDAVEAVMDKALDYHCRIPYFINN